MYAGQYRNNPLIENKLSVNNNHVKPSNPKTTPIRNLTSSSVPTKTVSSLTPRIPWLFATSASKVKYSQIPKQYLFSMCMKRKITNVILI
jgi:hypothetical protein